MKREASDHPKLWDLVDRLPEPYQGRAFAAGLLETLWHFTAKFTPAGNVGSKSDAAIARWIGWPGDPADLVEALVETRWLDRSDTHRLVVHDWPEHADDAIHRQLARARLTFADGTVPNWKRLNPDERAGAERFYTSDTNTGAHEAPDVRPPCAHEAHGGREPEPRLSPAPPEPVEEESPAPPARDPTPLKHPDALGLAEHLRDRVRERSPTAKLPAKLDAWAVTIDRMLRLDPADRDPPGIRQMIDWATADDFWSGNVLSAEALRRHWDKMQAQRLRCQRNPRDGPDPRRMTPHELAEAASRLLGETDDGRKSRDPGTDVLRLRASGDP